MSDTRETPPGESPTGTDAERALELADGYLEDAENALWNASKASEDDLAVELEALTRSIWDLQHRVDDLQRELEDGDR